MIKIEGAGGGLHENFSEFDFLFVFDRVYRYLSDAFGPRKNIVPSRSYSQSEDSSTV